MSGESRPSAEQLLARLQTQDRPRLRVYLGAAPGVGKTYTMLEDARALKARGVDIVVGFVETYGRVDTEAQIDDLEVLPRRPMPYRDVVLEEMDLDGILARKPQLCVVDELAHTNVPGSRHEKRYDDVLELLDRGISVMTAVNIQHLETLNDLVGRVTGVRVRETVPDTFLDRADEVVNVDTTVEELRSRLKQGKVYKPEKVEQALNNFFREGNLSTLRELALRAVADEVGEKAASYRAREGLEPGLIPERVMVSMSSSASAPKVLRAGARIAARLGARWYAVYVETPREAPARINPQDRKHLEDNIALAERLGATVVRVKAERPADGLIAFAQREGITHVIFGQTARTRFEILTKGSTLNRFLDEVKDAAVQVVPL
ncbi:MAG TPA: universal stress protein [Vicinamibacterales bacterium]|jgi:two-component system sensor histidine kinase KdpD|nr:universal stress protein [Vicinamibacterales bacterium]